MQNAIDLMILPPHCSHILQPLDVGVFAPLKRALACETDAVNRLDSGRVSRVEWTQMYIRARAKALTTSNILAGWRGAGLLPLSPISVLDKLPSRVTAAASPPHTPPQQADLDLSLLSSSPPNGTELREANALFNSTIRALQDAPSPTKRYAERMTRAFELTNSENMILRKQVKEQQELLHARKARKKGKRVELKGRFVFSTQEVLEIAKVAEAETAKKKTRGRPRKRKAEEIIEDEEDEVLENRYSDSDSDCIVVAMHK